LEQPPYEIALRGAPQEAGEAVPLLNVKVKVVTPTSLQRQMFKGQEVSARMGLMKQTEDKERERMELHQEQRASNCQIPSIDAMVLGMRKEGCFTAHELEHQLAHTVLKEEGERKTNIMITAKLLHTDKEKMEKVIMPQYESLLGYDLLGTRNASFQVGNRGQSLVLLLHLRTVLEARQVKNLTEELSITRFPMIAHYSTLTENVGEAWGDLTGSLGTF